MRFHLNLHNAHVDTKDEEGIELFDLSDARAQAIAGIRDFLAGEVRRAGKLDLHGHIDIMDDCGSLLETVQFHEAVNILR
ncbi:MAG: hypothetical protein JWN66_2219 [Sphingomonas bacterium]|jgi:hypothetical protein|uniref:DUF6894 family protein n=1 Tax=Sphingomonas bacterium TaxID=1895847 RepID=UPI00260FB5DB|nr:hypothetical protein [Sphingomonas bacterium]MDB5705103.1 hypothetical protein [Sphingomonas bacterium]